MPAKLGEQPARDLQLRRELNQALEQYRQASEAERSQAKRRYMEKLRHFSRLVMTGRI